jgi:hypothetical protein
MKEDSSVCQVNSIKNVVRVKYCKKPHKRKHAGHAASSSVNQSFFTAQYIYDPGAIM